jgi:cytochrome P450
MLDISLEVIVQAVYGVQQPEQVRVWSDAIRSVVGAFHPALIFAPGLQRGWFPPWRRVEAARPHHDALVYAELRARRATGLQGDDILSLMLQATYDDGEPMSDEAVRDELVTLLFAGHETTQIAMAWALYRLARRPEALARLQAELDGSDGSPEALARLPYLDAVVQETLRMQPIVPDLVRTLSVGLELGPWALPAGTHVAPVAAMVHVREDLYPDPHAFRPERFLEHKPRPWELLPFGGGVRRCIGAALATFEMKTVLGTWLRQVELRSLREDEPVRRNIAMGARHGVLMELVRRRGLPLRRVA